MGSDQLLHFITAIMGRAPKRKVGGKCYPSGQGSKFHHQSAYDDYYVYTYEPYGYYNGYAYEKRYTTWPSLFRGPGRPRDNKYQHPKVQFRQLNGTFPGYYEMTPYDYYGEAFYNGYSSSRPQQSSSSKRGYHKKVGRRNSKEGKDKEGEKKDKDKDRDKLYNDEFPPLNGNFDQQDTKGHKQVNGKGVWDNPPLWKGKEDLKTGHSSIKSHGGLHIYRSLVPTKPSLNGKFYQRDTKGHKQVNGKAVWDNPPLGKGKEDKKTGHSSIKSHSGLYIYRSRDPTKQMIGYTWWPLCSTEDEPRKTPGSTNNPSGSYWQSFSHTHDGRVFDLNPHIETSVSHKTNRDGLRLNGSRRDQTSFGAIRPPTSSSSSLPSYSKESMHGSPNPAMDILKTRFVTTPKTLGDKKSQFFKILRKENASKVEDGEKTSTEKQEKIQEQKPGENQLVNGIDNSEIEEANDSCVLFSSLEAELRLLREMGWNEFDEEIYEITEDDIKEFQNRSKQAQQQRSGLKCTLPKTWNRKLVPLSLYQAYMQELNESLSSDSDSDDSL